MRTGGDPKQEVFSGRGFSGGGAIERTPTRVPEASVVP